MQIELGQKPNMCRFRRLTGADASRWHHPRPRQDLVARERRKDLFIDRFGSTAAIGHVAELMNRSCNYLAPD